MPDAVRRRDLDFPIDAPFGGYWVGSAQPPVGEQPSLLMVRTFLSTSQAHGRPKHRRQGMR